MAEQSEQARLVAALQSKGYTINQIAALTGRSPRYITQARDSVQKVGKGGKIASGKGQNLIPALKSLNEKGKLSPAQMPERRKGKTGNVARVRKGTKTITTAKGVTHTVTNVKRGPKTLKKAITEAAKNDKRLQWRINYKKMKKYPDKDPEQGWASGHLPSGWNAQTLLDRINNPQPGDDWQPGDVNAALSSITIEQNPKNISMSGAQEFNLLTAD